MIDQAKEHLVESGASVPVNISPEVEEAGAIAHHEDKEHEAINTELRYGHFRI